MTPEKRGELASDICENIAAIENIRHVHIKHAESVLEALERLGYELIQVPEVEWLREPIGPSVRYRYVKDGYEIFVYEHGVWSVYRLDTYSAAASGCADDLESGKKAAIRAWALCRGANG